MGTLAAVLPVVRSRVVGDAPILARRPQAAVIPAAAAIPFPTPAVVIPVVVAAIPHPTPAAAITAGWELGL